MYLENNRVRQYPFMIFVSWFFVVVWMAFIFILSHQSESRSNAISQGIAEIFLRLFRPEYSSALLEQANQIVRDLAYGLVFGVLAIFVSWAMSNLGVQDISNALLTLLICALYAASDEFHQAFIPGRISSFRDFLIDMTGVAAGIVIYQVYSMFRMTHSDLQVDRDEILRL